MQTIIQQLIEDGAGAEKRELQIGREILGLCRALLNPVLKSQEMPRAHLAEIRDLAQELIQMHTSYGPSTPEAEAETTEWYARHDREGIPTGD